MVSPANRPDETPTGVQSGPCLPARAANAWRSSRGRQGKGVPIKEKTHRCRGRLTDPAGRGRWARSPLLGLVGVLGARAAKLVLLQGRLGMRVSRRREGADQDLLDQRPRVWALMGMILEDLPTGGAGASSVESLSWRKERSAQGSEQRLHNPEDPRLERRTAGLLSLSNADFKDSLASTVRTA